MGDRMTPIPFGNLMTWALSERKKQGTVFGVRKFYRADPNRTLPLFGEKAETPFGPAAGPNTQLAQNIIASYLAGSRFFELKTVQILDGEDLPVSKPCILAEDECYNCEWSTELTVPQACGEYIKAWVALKVLSREWNLGSPDGFIFNISLGYDLAGIQSEKIDSFINSMMEARDHPVFQECISWLKDHLELFEHLTAEDVESIPPDICKSATVSTLHGCPPGEIEAIASYLLKEKGLHTFVKCNPTLLGYEDARRILDGMGYDYVSFGDFHFRDDLQFEDAVPMLERLQSLASSLGLEFGVKITNTFPVDVTRHELPSEEMYMSGKALTALSLSVAYRLSEAFDGKLRISYSGGVDYFNVDRILSLGICPVTMATNLLKPGGYNRLYQIGEKLRKETYGAFTGIDVAGLGKLIEEIQKDPHHRKPLRPLPSRKSEKQVPLLECFTAPCMEGCPIRQDIPAYIRLSGEGKEEEALRVILSKNPLPFMTGTLCSHPCMAKCTRNFYEEPVGIRKVKLQAAQAGYDSVKASLKKGSGTGKKVAVVGAGPAGLSCAAFLSREGARVTVFDKSGCPGGTVSQVIPGFRISQESIEKDVDLVRSWGAQFILNTEISDLESLYDQGFEVIVLALGASRGVPLGIPTEREYNAVEFLRTCKENPDSLEMGEQVAVIGAGNTAMDAARAAKRLPGVKKVRIIYRRTARYMPADEEELREALEEGVEFLELLSPVSQKEGILTCKRMALGPADESGRQRPVETGETCEIPADTVIASLGERIDGTLYQRIGLAVNDRGIPVLNRKTMESSIPGVYVIGDGAEKPATMVLAIRDARAAADHILGKGTPVDFSYETDLTAAGDKKGILCHSGQGVPEKDRCLECSKLCENCVDVCPNRANVAIHVEGQAMPAILHIDYMCNECGNCRTFCPYSSAPYRDKFTFFACEKDFDNSENQGYVVLNRQQMKVKVRLGGKEEVYLLKDPGCTLYGGLRDLILTVDRDYPWLYL